MSSVLDAVVHSPGWLVLALVFVLPALESSTFLGLLVPGETMVLVGGAVAHSGRISLVAVIVLASVGAVLGDQVGFSVGRRFGRRRVDRLPQDSRRARQVTGALEVMQRRGASAAATARWVAGLRTVVPLVAGMGGMRRSTFTWANSLGGIAWSIGVAVAGYLAGASFQALGDKIGIASAIVCVLVLLAIGGWWLRRRRKLRDGSGTPSQRQSTSHPSST